MASHPSPSNVIQSPTLDADHSFFRAWALRTSKRESSDDVSPGSSPTPSGMTVGQRKGRRGELQRFGSEAGPSPLSYPIERTSSIQHTPFDVLSKDEPRPRKTKESVGSAVSGRTESTASSGIGDCTRKLLRLSEIRRSRNTSKDSQPPQEAKSGHSWYRELSGRWIEIKNGRKQHFEGDLPSPSIGDIREPLEVSASDQRYSALPANQHSIVNVVDNKIAKSAVSLPLREEIDSTTPKARANLTEKLGFYFRTKRGWRPKRPVSTKALRPSDESLSTTEDVLNRASSLLRDLTSKKPAPSSTSTSPNLSIADTFHQRPGFLWRNTGHSSSSSSIRILLMGKSPTGTPESEAWYMGSDNKKYMRVEISDADASTFLPSEARRIGTPPLLSPSPRRVSPPYYTPSAVLFQQQQHQPSSLQATVPVSLKSAIPEAPSVTQRDAIMAFELNVHEHSSSSSLCPTSPGHPSGGKGVCVYHGRARPGYKPC